MSGGIVPPTAIPAGWTDKLKESVVKGWVDRESGGVGGMGVGRWWWWGYRAAYCVSLCVHLRLCPTAPDRRAGGHACKPRSCGPPSCLAESVYSLFRGARLLYLFAIIVILSPHSIDRLLSR